MNKTILKSAIAAIALIGTVGLAGCSDHTAMPLGNSTSRSQSPAGSAPSSIFGEFNDADVMFAQMMIPHHEQAVTMSDMLLSKSGVNTDVVALAQDIKAAQTPEIKKMNEWLDAWGRPVRTTGDMNHGGGENGMSTVEEMENLDKADGATAPKMYLSMMTKHHAGAIEMAQTEINDGKNPHAVQMAKEILTTQQAEIKIMQDLLARL
ncbi:MAG: hypothetical protein JWN06_2386 [Propionibacteriaceae bacterium]|jgi:uncharacterized protein (DUF305 family)|nr:hypothetical protein [Propionibacteriaceae bacterium]